MIHTIPQPSGAEAPIAISDRCTPMSYGIRTNMLAESRDPANMQYVHKEDGKLYCKDRFDQFIEKGRAVGVDEVFEHSFVPASSYGRTASFDLYATDQRSARYTSDPGMRLLANVEVHIHNPTGRLANRNAYELRAKMHTGRAELTLAVYDPQTGKQVKTTVNFL